MTTKKLGELATFINGRAFKPSEWSDAGIPIIRIQNLTNSEGDFNYFNGDYDDKHLVNTNDLLISWSATLDVFRWKGGTALLNQHIFKVVFDKCEIDKDYFYYAVKNELEYMRTQTHGSTMKHITKKPFENIEIYFPPIDLQKKIALNLNKIDEVRATNSKAQDLSDAYPLALFNKMFGSVEENRNKLPSKKLGDVCDIIIGRTPPRDNLRYWEGTHPWLTVAELNGHEIHETKEKITDLAITEIKPRLIPAGTVLFSFKLSIGKMGINKVPLYTNEAIAALIPKNNHEIMPEYLYYALLSQDFSGKARDAVKGKVLNKGHLSMFDILLPEVGEQNKFAQKISTFKKAQEAQQKVADKLRILFASLSNKYFNPN